MNSQIFSCEMCLSDYDNGNKTPYIIPVCGHNMCSSCLITFLVSNETDQFTCPFDSKTMTLTEPSISHFPKNHTIIKMITEKGTKSHEQEAVQQIQEVALLRRRSLSEQDIYPELQQDKPASEELEFVVTNKLGNLEKVISDIEMLEKNIYDKVEESLVDKEKYMLRMLDNKIAECHNLLDKKKKEISDELIAHFAGVKDKVRRRVNPHESQYEAKTQVIQWKNLTKKKIEDWNAKKTVNIANNIIEEDATAMLPEIKVWTNRIKSLLAAGNLDTFVDKSLLTFDEDFSKAVSSLCELKVISEEKTGRQDIFLEEDSPLALKNFLRIDSRPTSQFSTDAQNLLNKLFKAYNLKVQSDSNDLGDIRLKPNLNVLLTAGSKDKRKISTGGDFDEIENLQVTCEEFKDKHLVQFGEAVQCLESLKEFKLVLLNCEKLSDNALESFGSTLGAPSILESLTLEFVSCSLKTSDQGLSKLIRAISTNENLKKLNLSLGKLSGVSKSGFSAFWKELIVVKSLKQIKVSAPADLHLDDEELATISTSLKKMTNLQEFELVLSGNDKITNKGLIALSDALGKLVNLTKLKLKFDEENSLMNDKGFAQLTATISKLGLLNSLTLNFPKSYVSNEKFIGLSQTVSKLCFLKHLNLDFSWSLISDEGLKELSKAVSNLYNITSFNVNFSACNMSNGGFKDLVDVISGLFNLHKLSLNFSWCKEITDEGVMDLGKAISRLTHLSKLEVNFKEAKKITEASALQLCELIPKFNSIEFFDFNLVNCGKDITKDSQVKLDMALSTGRKQIKKRILIAP